MYRFVGFVWNGNNAHASAFATMLSGRLRVFSNDFQCLSHSGGLIVFYKPLHTRAPQAYTLPNKAGVILGRIFPANLDAWHPSWTPTFDEHTSSELVRTGGRKLIESYWGSYVAFLRNTDGCHQYVLRDCSGGIPCFRITHNEVTILFSDISDIANLPLPKFTINRHYLAAFIYSMRLQVRDCGFNEISELLAGDCLEIKNESTRQFSIWDPRELCRTHSVDDYSEAIVKLKNTTQRCIDAWASVHEGILLSLSGGLDSAVVLGCLAKSPAHPRLTCVNRFTDVAGEDERRYARLAASQASVSLIEHSWNPQRCLFDRDLLAAARTAKPTMSILTAAAEIDFANQLAAGERAEAVWTGQGGDHLFYQTATSLGAADYVTRRGCGRGLTSCVRDGAHLSGKPFWSVLREAWQLGRSRTTWTPSDVGYLQPHFVNVDALPVTPSEYASHPWAADGDDLPKGKQYQIRMLGELLNRHRPDPRWTDAIEHHPLLSQPIIELCLQIPTYLLLHGGRQRSLARDAFQDRVPPEIIAREDKGSTTSSAIGEFRRSEAFICELLLDGILVREGIVSQKELEPYLISNRPLREEHLFPLFACIASEIWARTWADKQVYESPKVAYAHLTS